MTILSAGDVRLVLEGFDGNPPTTAASLTAIPSLDRSSVDCTLRLAARRRGVGGPSLRIGLFAATVRTDTQPGSPTLVISPAERPHPLVPGPLFRLIHPGFVSRSEYISYMATDQVIDPLVHLLGIQSEQSCLHASAVERDGRAVAVVGSGGSGKTPAMLHLLQGGWRFLSDDWTTVDTHGRMQPTYKVLELHAHDIEPDQGMLGLLHRSQSPVDRVAWRLRSVGGPSPALRRRIDATDLLPRNLIGGSAQLSDVFIVVRSSEQDISLTNVAPSQAAEIAARLTLQDLPTLNQVLDLAAQMPWTHAEALGVEGATRSILDRAFSQARSTVISVPMPTPEREIGRLIAESVADG